MEEEAGETSRKHSIALGRLKERGKNETATGKGNHTGEGQSGGERTDKRSIPVDIGKEI